MERSRYGMPFELLSTTIVLSSRLHSEVFGIWRSERHLEVPDIWTDLVQLYELHILDVGSTLVHMI